MQIVKAPNNVLSTPTKKVEKIEKTLHELIKDMKHTLITASDPEGVGLAAPQVGQGIQLFIIKPTKSSPISVFINPEVTLIGKKVPRKTKEGKSKLEGCLSIDDIWGTVKRSTKIHVTWLDEHSTSHEKDFTGWPATIIQHEKDHLDGILFPRRVLEQKGKLYRLKRDEKGEEYFDSLEL